MTQVLVESPLDRPPSRPSPEAAKPQHERRGAIRAVVLAGTHEWDSSALSRLMPRVLLPVAGRPLIAHALEWLAGHGIREVDVCANSDTLFLSRFLGGGEAVNLDLNYYQDVMPRGPAGCVADAARHSDAEHLVVVEGCVIPQVDLDDLLQTHLESEALVTMVAARTSTGGAHRDAAVEPAGVYIFSRSVVEHVPDCGYQDIKEGVIPRLYARNERVLAYMAACASVPRVSGTDSYLSVNEWMIERVTRERRPPAGYRRLGEARVHESARLDPAARLAGPVVIEANCVLSPDALVIGPAVLGKGCVLEQGSVVSRSVLWAGCRIGRRAHADRCVLTDHTVIDPDMVARSRLYTTSHSPRPTLGELATRCMWCPDAGPHCRSRCLQVTAEAACPVWSPAHDPCETCASPVECGPPAVTSHGER